MTEFVLTIEKLGVFERVGLGWELGLLALLGGGKKVVHCRVSTRMNLCQFPKHTMPFDDFLSGLLV